VGHVSNMLGVTRPVLANPSCTSGNVRHDSFSTLAWKLNRTAMSESSKKGKDTGFALVAKRFTNWTSNLLVTAIVIVAALTFGRQLTYWWATDPDNGKEHVSARRPDSRGRRGSGRATASCRDGAACVILGIRPSDRIGWTALDTVHVRPGGWFVGICPRSAGRTQSSRGTARHVLANRRPTRGRLFCWRGKSAKLASFF
jgi:hypothetical protein